MNKYKRLVLNTLVFTIGSFGAKIISLFLNNLYTKHISPADLYAKSLLETLALFLIPLFSFSVTEAVVRFGLDKQYQKEQVFSTALGINLAGMLPMLLLVPLLPCIPFFSRVGGYTVLLLFYIAASCARALCAQFVRARGMVRLFSLDGILTTLTLFLFNIVFIGHLGMGVRGFMLSSVLSDLCSALFLFLIAGLWRFCGVRYFSKGLCISMLRFTLPLIPSTIMWTFTGFSDQIFIGNMHSEKVFIGEEAAGIYAAASKIPNLISMLSTIFFQAWNMSAITENEAADRNQFYGNVYRAYESILFMGATGLILLVKPVCALLINYSTFPVYRTAYLYTPLLIAAAVYTCLDLFLASIYTATKHTRNALYTILIVCLMNILLNFLLIPRIGMQGAALATLMSYLLCYAVRILDARRYVHFPYALGRHGLNLLLLAALCACCVLQIQGQQFCCILLTGLVILLNIQPILLIGRRFLKR